MVHVPSGPLGVRWCAYDPMTVHASRAYTWMLQWKPCKRSCLPSPRLGKLSLHTLETTRSKLTSRWDCHQTSSQLQTCWWKLPFWNCVVVKTPHWPLWRKIWMAHSTCGLIAESKSTLGIPKIASTGLTSLQFWGGINWEAKEDPTAWSVKTWKAVQKTENFSPPKDLSVALNENSK